jgi:hypothetical protein
MRISDCGLNGHDFNTVVIGATRHSETMKMVPLAQPAVRLAGLASVLARSHWQAPANGRGRVPVAPIFGTVSLQHHWIFHD